MLSVIVSCAKRAQTPSLIRDTSNFDATPGGGGNDACHVGNYATNHSIVIIIPITDVNLSIIQSSAENPFIIIKVFRFFLLVSFNSSLGKSVTMQP